MTVEVTLSPWSRKHLELAIRPISWGFGRHPSKRCIDAAHDIIDALAEQMVTWLDDELIAAFLDDTHGLIDVHD